MSKDERARSWPRTLLVGAVVWVLLAAFLVVLGLPNLPQSALQWVLLVLLGPPVYVLGEGFFGWLFSRKHGMTISQKRFSIKRIAVALSVCVMIAALIWWLSWLLTAS